MNIGKEIYRHFVKQLMDLAEYVLVFSLLKKSSKPKNSNCPRFDSFISIATCLDFFFSNL